MQCGGNSGPISIEGRTSLPVGLFENLNRRQSLTVFPCFLIHSDFQLYTNYTFATPWNSLYKLHLRYTLELFTQTSPSLHPGKLYTNYTFATPWNALHKLQLNSQLHRTHYLLSHYVSSHVCIMYYIK